MDDAKVSAKPAKKMATMEDTEMPATMADNQTLIEDDGSSVTAEAVSTEESTKATTKLAMRLVAMEDAKPSTKPSAKLDKKVALMEDTKATL